MDFRYCSVFCFIFFVSFEYLFILRDIFQAILFFDDFIRR